ncbi:zinc transport system ATP-binding protein [Pullulanibacillus pueri]|uniref:ABC transporter ATP-binding protein n=1 Tax=Pullulanibacillus pueri TaxID=1437324 RepID=A0A8J2ZTC2_9BACL|nr:metal ABC transporter ATP-binding protein [Pullulanibacillus pueri]MBM7681177.1 zinc transport system ATP-binding protein [Pullulanibacillus pueri]GGH77349.1 ABC transporter ATP-binding protein [Pullulanibacillus pueri]
MEKALRLSEVTINYHTQIAVQNVSLTVDQGEFLVITGPNGGGKSSLIKAILSLIPVTKGTIEILGKQQSEVKGKIGYVPQQTHFDHSFPITVRDAILMGRLPSKIGWFYRYSQTDHEVVNDLLEQMNIAGLAKRQLNELSGGQKQKVLIARALSSKPEVLILDEPTASLDVKAKAQIYDILKTLSQSMTIVMISHDEQLIARYASTIVFLNKEILYKGTELPHSPFNLGFGLSSMEALHEH